MVIPPFKKQHEQARSGNPAPHFQAGALQGGRGYFAVFAEGQLVAGHNITFGGVGQVDTECDFVGAGLKAIDALLK